MMIGLVENNPRGILVEVRDVVPMFREVDRRELALRSLGRRKDCIFEEGRERRGALHAR